MGFGENLRTMRRKKNISQEELAGNECQQAGDIPMGTG